MKQDDIEYAIENTQVILAPERQIATFGNTSFEFHLISELMDRVDQVRIRTGRIDAGKGCAEMLAHYARYRRLTHVYLGYRVEGCPSLQYKGRFRPQERLHGRVEVGHAPRWEPG